MRYTLRLINSWQDIFEDIAADNLKELAERYYIFKTCHNNKNFRLILYDNNKTLADRSIANQFFEIYNKIKKMELRKKEIRKDFNEI